MKPQELQTVSSKSPLVDFLKSDQFKGEIASLHSKHVTPDRMVRVALTAMNRQPDLLECSRSSFFSAMMRLSEVGLEPDGYHAHLIPFNNRIKNSNPPKYRKDVQLVIDYKGLVTVIRRNTAIAVVRGGVVYKQDKFIYREGSDRYFEHEPAWVENDEIIGAYSFVKFANINDWECDFLPTWKIEKARRTSRAADRGPWVTNYDEMCIKTALRHHAKTLPLTAEERAATLNDDDTIDLEDRKSLPQRTAEFRGKQKIEVSEPEEEITAIEDETVSEGSQEDTGPHEEIAKEHSVSLAKLQSKMDEGKVTDSELISVLIDHSMSVGDAENQGKISSLPVETIKVATKQWPTLYFSINAKRKLNVEVQK